MPRVYCSIPNTEPGLINGQQFEHDEDGKLVSVGEVSADNLALFAQVPGYAVEEGEVDPEVAAKAAAKTAAAAAKAAKAAKP